MKKSFVVVAAATALFAVPALAADLPRKAPVYAPPLPPPFSWTGFYGGIHAGWGFSNSDASITSSPAGVFDPASIGQNSNGVVGGIQVGYNWQFAPNWVLGIEGDFSGTGIRDTSVGAISTGGVPIGTPGFNNIADRDVKWLASIRGRLGYAADRWLWYVTGGGAWAGIDYTFGPSFPGLFGTATSNDTVSGWTVGGGVEYAFTNNWTGRLEYLFYDLGDTNIVNVSPAGPITATTSWENQFHVVRLGVNYKF